MDYEAISNQGEKSMFMPGRRNSITPEPQLYFDNLTRNVRMENPVFPNLYQCSPNTQRMACYSVPPHQIKGSNTRPTNPYYSYLISSNLTEQFKYEHQQPYFWSPEKATEDNFLIPSLRKRVDKSDVNKNKKPGTKINKNSQYMRKRRKLCDADNSNNCAGFGICSSDASNFNKAWDQNNINHNDVDAEKAIQSLIESIKPDEIKSHVGRKPNFKTNGSLPTPLIFNTNQNDSQNKNIYRESITGSKIKNTNLFELNTGFQHAHFNASSDLSNNEETSEINNAFSANKNWSLNQVKNSTEKETDMHYAKFNYRGAENNIQICESTKEEETDMYFDKSNYGGAENNIQICESTKKLETDMHYDKSNSREAENNIQICESPKKLETDMYYGKSNFREAENNTQICESDLHSGEATKSVNSECETSETYYLQPCEGKDENGKDIIVYMLICPDNEILQTSNAELLTTEVANLNYHPESVENATQDTNFEFESDENPNKEMGNDDIKIEFFSNLNDFISEETIDCSDYLNKPKEMDNEIKIKSKNLKAGRTKRNLIANEKILKRKRVAKIPSSSIGIQNLLRSYKKTKMLQKKCIKKKTNLNKALWKVKFMCKSKNMTLHNLQKVYFDKIMQSCILKNQAINNDMTAKIIKPIFHRLGENITNSLISAFCDIKKLLNLKMNPKPTMKKTQAEKKTFGYCNVLSKRKRVIFESTDTQKRMHQNLY